ncbi:hypothetical protein ACU4GR_07970 (plasmid) [Methylobacterium oryzae CBMB20]
MRYASAAAAIAFVMAGPALAAQPFEGSWAEQTANCGSDSDSNISISGRKYRTHETECSISKMDQSKGTYALFLSCSGEGEKWTDAVVLVPQGNRMLVGSTSGRPMIRCRN